MSQHLPPASPSGTARRPPPTSIVEAYVRGLWYPVEGMSILASRGVLPWALAAVAVNLLLVAALVVVGVWALVPWVQDLDAWLRGSALLSHDLAAWITGVVLVLVWIIAVVLVGSAAALVTVLVGQAVASPFLDLMSEAIETRVLGTAPVPFSVGRLVAAVRIALGDLFWGLVLYVVVQVPIFLVSLLTFGVPSAVASFCFGALLLAQEFVGLALTRRLVSYRRRFAVVWRNRWVCLGFGTTAMLLLVVPGLNLALLPLAAAGGTLLYCDLALAGRVGTDVAPR